MDDELGCGLRDGRVEVFLVEVLLLDCVGFDAAFALLFDTEVTFRGLGGEHDSNKSRILN